MLLHGLLMWALVSAEFGREQDSRLGSVSARIQSFATEQYAQNPQAGKQPAQRLSPSPHPCVDD